MTVIVTGATSGFGAAISRRFIREGHFVIGIGRRTEKLENLRLELGNSFFPLKADIDIATELEKAMNTIPENLKPFSILINNAGLALGLEPAHQSQMKDWEQMIKTNINGLLHCTHLILPEMVKNNKGHIINIGSVAAEVPYPGGNVYGATKAFVRQFSLNLRADLFGTKVRVSEVEPGLCSGTEFSLVRFKGDESKVQKTYEGSNALTPEDIAETVFWISQLPERVNINTISLMPVTQSFGPLLINRS